MIEDAENAELPVWLRFLQSLGLPLQLRYRVLQVAADAAAIKLWWPIGLGHPEAVLQRKDASHQTLSVSN